IGTLLAEFEHWLSIALARQGSHAEARRAAERSIVEGINLDVRWIEGRARAVLASIMLASGSIEEADAEVRRAIDVSAGIPIVRALAIGALAEIQLQRGLPGEAASLCAEALQVLGCAPAIEEAEGLIRLVHAEALRATGAVDEARLAIIAARDRL